VLAVVAQGGQRREGVSLPDDVVREGERRMLAAALEAEVDAYLAELAGEGDEQGRGLVVRNGRAPPRPPRSYAGAPRPLARPAVWSSSSRMAPPATILACSPR
jgi:putative transposase